MEINSAQDPPLCKWGNTTMGDELLGDLLYSGQMYVCQSHDISKHPQRYSYQVYGFCTGIYSD